ncbi:uncharacterized protein PGTG_10511 [Puccinia graminis f. sp. tritici CRL 75-36-700-3]|uniref:Tet-like 2OG-Fe(II) oxygenase domain-containing protein n=1 Tax=Puccinia graminis f. sp. tritici (strain CRL 75-36-700-3 / race SCCL) TaxID=418459 RepID=E3KIK8_PUCGT|nr:uncharacterized protein PGTG_10511 [Puccinia graminis f. sp. tritici CRL 75-36-700-3]EFP84133.2 hypothetical protein PGTG_10511 [Puccinia graminis f. sp. tritici CRL 75-36-700-3]
MAHNKRKQSQHKNKLLRERRERASLVESAIGPSGRKFYWQNVKYEDLNIYPTIPRALVRGKLQYTRPPTSEEIAMASDTVQTFRLLKTGCNIVQDPQDPKSIIAIIEFTKFSDLTEADREELNFVSTFLRKTTRFISNVKSKQCAWGGKMWGIGGRKSSDEDQIAGRYIKAFEAVHAQAYHDLFSLSGRVGQIVGRNFKKLAEIPFGSNRDLMAEHGLPSLAALEYGEDLTESDCAPHLTFTTNGFFNPPHTDDEDVSKYAFVMFLPTHTKDGSLATDEDSYDITSGPFIFPDHKFGINFDHQFGLVKMIWQANKYKHSPDLPAWVCLYKSI